MLTNFLNVWLLARVMQAGVAATLAVLGAALGLRIAWRWRSGQSDEAQLTLERQAELVAAVMQVTLGVGIVGLALSVFVADHLVGGIRGAMCAFGVLASTASGFAGLAVSAFAAVACGWWVVLHRFDLRLETPWLTRRKLLALLAVAPWSVADFVLAVRFAYELDFSVIASCCSVWLDDTAIQSQAARLVVSPNLAGGLGLVTVALAGAASLWVWRRPGRVTALTCAALSGVATLAALPAVLGVVAPYTLATPGHLCPFCLLHAQGGWLGWPLFGALFAAAVTGVGVGLVEWQRPANQPAERVREFQRALARWSALAWLGVLMAGVFPVARNLFRSGGISVFGEV
jgi:hypothetical protein